jgi:hypothetical protein
VWQTGVNVETKLLMPEEWPAVRAGLRERLD